ncbi:ribonuclease H-like domain-containing protein [Tanacetum coccineum]
MVSTVKLPMFKKGEYTLWSMRMEQYLTNTDYSLWQVILNGDGPIQVTTDKKGIETEVPLKTAQALLQRQRERKAKSILLLAIPDEYQLRFHGIKDAKSLWAAIKSRFGGNVESKKTQKTVLKQQFENFFVSDTEGLDKAYDRFQKLISLLEVHVLIDDIKVHLDHLQTLRLWLSLAEDLAAVMKLIMLISNSPQLDDEDLEQIDHDDLEEMDLKCRWSLLSNEGAHFSRECRAPRNQGNMNGDAGYRSRDNTRRTVLVETSDALGIFWIMLWCDPNKANLEIIAYQLGLESVEAQLVVHQKNEAVYEEKIAVLEFEVKDKSNAITRLKNHQISSKDKTGLGYGDQLNENDSSGSELFNSVFDSRSSDGDDNQTNDRFKKDNGYHVVPPPLTGNYMPPLADLSFAGLEMPRVESVRPSGVIIEDWVSDDDEDIFQSNDVQATDKPNFKRIEFTNAKNESVKPKQAEKPRITTQNSKVDKRDWNGKMTQKLGLGFGISNEKVNTVRVNGVNTTGQTTISTVKENGVTTVKASAGCVWRPKMTNLYNVSKDNSGSWVSKRGNPQQALKNKGIFDNGCSRHMTGNKDFFIDYQDIDGGFVAFGGSARGGKITGKGKIRTDKLDFEDVFFVKELKFNLLCVSQMCDKKNNVLFTETECLVLSPDFKLLDTSQVLLRVPRQSNMYSFDLKNVVLSGDLTWIKREFSVARTPQQNGVAERKNMTLIEAARTMLADSLLPTVF